VACWLRQLREQQDYEAHQAASLPPATGLGAQADLPSGTNVTATAIEPGG